MARAEAREIAALRALEAEVASCRACPRLVEWREHVATEKVARFADQTYWGKPVPGFGDPAASIVIVGLAPAANGANRTGRMFTGDRSGDFLYASLYRMSLASQPTSTSRDDGLELHGVWITAVNRCAPPANKPTSLERDTCLPFMERELALLPSARVIVALGAYAWDGALRALASLDVAAMKPKPRFSHGAEVAVGNLALLGTYHPSQQNTFTGRLTEPMLDEIFRRAGAMASAPRVALD